jgi:hypothetical protein
MLLTLGGRLGLGLRAGGVLAAVFAVAFFAGFFAVDFFAVAFVVRPLVCGFFVVFAIFFSLLKVFFSGN